MSKSVPFILNPGEREIIHLHRHPIVFFLQSIPLLFLLVAPIFGIAIFRNTGLELPANDLVQIGIILLAGIYYLYISLFLFYNYFDFILDIWVVTNERVVNVEQYGLFNRVASEQEIPKIQDITSEIKGIFPSIFNYGNIYVQTAAEKEHFIFRDIKHPQLVVSTISKIIDLSMQHDTEKSKL